MRERRKSRRLILLHPGSLLQYIPAATQMPYIKMAVDDKAWFDASHTDAISRLWMIIADSPQSGPNSYNSSMVFLASPRLDPTLGHKVTATLTATARERSNECRQLPPVLLTTNDSAAASCTQGCHVCRPKVLGQYPLLRSADKMAGCSDRLCPTPLDSWRYPSVACDLASGRSMHAIVFTCEKHSLSPSNTQQTSNLACDGKFPSKTHSIL